MPTFHPQLLQELDFKGLFSTNSVLMELLHMYQNLEAGNC